MSKDTHCNGWTAVDIPATTHPSNTRRVILSDRPNERPTDRMVSSGIPSCRDTAHSPHSLTPSRMDATT